MLIRFKSKMHYVWSATNSGKLIAVEAEHTPCDDLMATAVIVATADEDWTRQMRRQNTWCESAICFCCLYFECNMRKPITLRTRKIHNVSFFCLSIAHILYTSGESEAAAVGLCSSHSNQN